MDAAGLGPQEAWVTCAQTAVIIRLPWCSCSCHGEAKVISELQQLGEASIELTDHLPPGRAGRPQSTAGLWQPEAAGQCAGPAWTCVSPAARPTCLPECPALGDRSPPLCLVTCLEPRPLVEVCGSPVPPRCGIQPECHVCACLMRVLTRHICASACACTRASMFLTCWLLSQSIYLCYAEPGSQPGTPCRWGYSHQ